MNKKEVLDAISQEFRESLQDIGATNGDVIKAMFPNAEISQNPYTPSVDVFFGDSGIMMMRVGRSLWNAKYKENTNAL